LGHFVEQIISGGLSGDYVRSLTIVSMNPLRHNPPILGQNLILHVASHNFGGQRNISCAEGNIFFGGGIYVPFGVHLWVKFIIRSTVTFQYLCRLSVMCITWGILFGGLCAQSGGITAVRCIYTLA